MTVQELIEQLQRLPSVADVWVELCCGDERYEPAYQVYLDADGDVRVSA